MMFTTPIPSSLSAQSKYHHVTLSNILTQNKREDITIYQYKSLLQAYAVQKCISQIMHTEVGEIYDMRSA